jgi:hypothetical protein
LPQNLPEEKKFQRTSGGWLSPCASFLEWSRRRHRQEVSISRAALAM